LGKSQPVAISPVPLRLRVQATLTPAGEIVLRSPDTANLNLIRGSQPWVWRDQTFCPLPLPTNLLALCDGPVKIPRSNIPQFLNLDWPALVARYDLEANFSPEDFSLEAATPRFRLHLAGGMAMLQARLECFYGDRQVIPAVAGKDEVLWLADPQSPTLYRTRDFGAEQQAVARLLRQGFTGPDGSGLYHLKDQTAVLNFFAREYPRLEREWQTTLEERLDRSTRNNIERIEPRFQITPSGEQWFDLAVTYDTAGGEKFAAADIQRLLLSGQSHTRLKSGKFALIDTSAVEELQEVLLDCAPQQHANGFRLDNSQAAFLEGTLRKQPQWKVTAPTAWSQRTAQLRGEVKLPLPPLGHLESVLRPYQKEGVAWLQFLRTNGFGGVLADEMGLGKTLQVLALLQILPRAERTPTLVVCPTSVVFNWVAEAGRFTPDLRVLSLQGPRRRELFAQIPHHDLIVTSYTLLRRDTDLYAGLQFDTVILDEAQHIKNRQTQNAQAVKSIRSNHRLVLTGTPLENSVLDLWSIFDFLMPGYLGGAQDFRERYEQSITRDRSVESQNRLARRLRPFLLRRLKREVAADLPEKIEQVSYCELNEDQRALYRQLLEAGRREILTAVDANGLAKSRMLVLTTLLRLRQICCDPRLLKLESSAPDASQAAPSSGKTELFGELLEEVIDGGHRALVFSQFTTMLGLLRDQLIADGIEYCYLDGSTKNRAEVVESFQRNSKIPIFLISLKAGGTGLNLTGADTVIHFDPWWNPAVEAQATDRAHRIGQKRVVTSYKLITRDTVEEKILNLQTRKRALIQSIFGEEQLAEALSWEEIQELFAM
jgi:superfamily II DNA or RNA helicase